LTTDEDVGFSFLSFFLSFFLLVVVDFCFSYVLFVLGVCLDVMGGDSCKFAIKKAAAML
jgi:hypothetical protein